MAVFLATMLVAATAGAQERPAIDSTSTGATGAPPGRNRVRS
ncbi:MAG: hypothetical protein R2716_11825 [Microthrixaceae bacterium]